MPLVMMPNGVNVFSTYVEVILVAPLVTVIMSVFSTYVEVILKLAVK